MCVIVDTNKFGDFMGRRGMSEKVRLLREWIESGDGGFLIYPEIETLGKMPEPAARDMRRLISEYRKSPNMLALLGQYAGLGRARRVELSEVARKHPDTAKARSDDRHVLALALASGARLLYTGDRKLGRDFRDPAIMGDVGEVYSSPDQLRPDLCENC